MKLILQNDKVIATATDEYVTQGWEQVVMDAPEDYDPSKMGAYLLEDGALIYPAWDIVRAQRNALLADCDWTQLPDAPVNAAEWAAYRQDLRDITEQADPLNIAWPTLPQ